MKRESKLGPASAILFGALAFSLASADQIFSDRAAFIAATAADVIIDFEGLPVGPVIGDPWWAQGVAFDEAGVGDNMALADGNGADFNIYATGGQSANIDISLASDIYAFGLGIFSNQVQNSGERIIFYGASNLILENIEMPATGPGTSEFVGYVADEPIVLVEFIEDDADGDYVGIGDIALRNGALVGIESQSWGQIKATFR